MEIISITKTNIEQEHICCAIGNDKKNKIRAQTKKDWMTDRFEDGLVFKRLNERGKIFIEYMPIEKVWKPIKGKNFMVINCLWVSGQFKGEGYSTHLLNECITDAKNKKMDGVVVVSSSKVNPFLTDKKFYLKHNFEIIDSAPPYFELLAYKIYKNAKNPSFTETAKKGGFKNGKGFSFIYSNQCPFMDEWIDILSNISKSKKIPFEIIKLQSYKEAQQTGSPFGTLGIYYNGEFKTHSLMPEKEFLKLIEEIKNH